MSLRLLSAKLGRSSRERATITIELDEEDLEYLTTIMTEEHLRDERDGAPTDYLETFADAAARLADEREFRANQPRLVFRVGLR